MASKFYIEVEIPEITTLPPKVRMVDDDQDEVTPWVEAVGFRQQPPEVIFAAALLASTEIQEMVKIAKQVAYAVWLNDDYFDIHKITPMTAQAMVQHAKMDEATSQVVSISQPRLRM
jgi:hypothetical protein